MTPRLVLLRGPAAGEVAALFQVPCSTWPWMCGFEVRDYWEAPRKVADEASLCPDGYSDREAAEAAVRSLPGGEALLVGLVLPEPAVKDLRMGGNHIYWPWAHRHVQRETGRQDPARLAIRAPEPPPLLVERVRAWGGEEWDCHEIPMVKQIGVGGVWHSGDTWPEAVRAALNGVAP